MGEMREYFARNLVPIGNGSPGLRSAISIFLLHSDWGTLAGGFKAVNVRKRGQEWMPVYDGANTPAWLRDDVLMVQREAYVDDGVHAYLEKITGETYDRKASELKAGGNRWCAFYGRPPGLIYDGMDRTIFGDTVSGKLRGAGKHAVGVDETLVYTPRYQDDMAVVIEDGQRNQIARFDAERLVTSACVNRDAVAWFPGGKTVRFFDGRLHSFELAWPAYAASLFQRPDGYWLAYASGEMERVIVHRIDDPSRGWLLGREDHAYNPCGWHDGASSTTFIAWSENAGATTASIKEEPLTGDPRPFRDDPTPGPGPDPGPLPPATACRLHACAMDGTKPGGKVMLTPGSVAWGACPSDQRLWYEGMPWASGCSRLWALVYGTERDVPDPYANKREQLDASIGEALKRQVALVIYCDQRGFSDEAREAERHARANGVMTMWGLLMLPRAGQTAEACEEETEAWVKQARAESRRVVLYSNIRDGHGVENVRVQPMCHKLIDRKYKSTIVGHVIFGAGSGTETSSELAAWWAATWTLMPAGVILPLR